MGKASRVDGMVGGELDGRRETDTQATSHMLAKSRTDSQLTKQESSTHSNGTTNATTTRKHVTKRPTEKSQDTRKSGSIGRHSIPELSHDRYRTYAKQFPQTHISPFSFLP